MNRIWLALAVLAATAFTGCAEPPPESPPQQLSESPFHYPEALWDAGVEGTTLLEIHVTEAGQVDSVHVEQSSGHPEFDSAALDGASELRFEPARRGEETVAVWVRLPVEFHLPDGDRASDSDSAVDTSATDSNEADQAGP